MLSIASLALGLNMRSAVLPTSSARAPAASMQAALETPEAPVAVTADLQGAVVPTATVKLTATLKPNDTLFNDFILDNGRKGPLSANFAANMGDCCHFIDGKVSKRINPATPSSYRSDFVYDEEKTPLGLSIGCSFKC